MSSRQSKLELPTSEKIQEAMENLSGKAYALKRDLIPSVGIPTLLTAWIGGLEYSDWREFHNAVSFKERYANSVLTKVGEMLPDIPHIIEESYLKGLVAAAVGVVVVGASIIECYGLYEQKKDKDKYQSPLEKALSKQTLDTNETSMVIKAVNKYARA